MSKIPMKRGFTLIPEGEYIFKIMDADYDEDFGKITIYLETSSGLKHQERFSIKNKNDEYVDGALSAFSFFASTALQDFSIEEIEISDLIGHYIKAEVVHMTLPSKNNPDKTVTFANLGNKYPADGFEDVPAEEIDLDALLS